MAKKHPKPLDACHTHNDFRQQAVSHDARVRNGRGSRVVVVTPRGSTTIPHAQHPNEPLPKGTQSALRRQFIALGLAALVVALVLLPVFA